MSELWPHLPEVVGATVYTEILASGHPPTPSYSHPEQTWAPVGSRVSEARIRQLIDSTTALAQGFGFPVPAGPDARVAFDREAAKAVRAHMDLSWSEAGSRDLWSFLSLIALPDITMWRFGPDNRERWLASDLTRHTWSRLWWQAVVFEGHDDLLITLSESDLNQLLERRSIGGDPRLAREIARAVVHGAENVPRRPLIRDVTRRLRRYLAFLDTRALSDEQVRSFCSMLTMETITRLDIDAPSVPSH